MSEKATYGTGSEAGGRTGNIEPNPRITDVLYWVTGVESFVLFVAGVGLLLFPSIVAPEWPWELTRFNALLLGSIYSASLVATVATVVSRRWAPARIVLPMIFLFTSIVLIVSLGYLDRFDLGYYSTWLWFLLYIVIPANALVHMWLYRDLHTYEPVRIENPWRFAVLLPTMVLGLYGLGLLLAPATFGSFWPWPIDDFHGRMYSVAYLTPALGAILVFRGAARIELRTLGLTIATGGFIPVIGLAIVDSQIGKVDWSVSGTWLWLASFAILFLAGLGLTWQARSAE